MINRREFLAAGGAAAALAGCGAFGRDYSVPGLPVPKPAQLAWQQAELGVLFCHELHVFVEGRYNQGAARRTPIPDPNIFNPVDLDTDQWIEAAAAMGARFAIFTASHESGFRLWQSDANPYCLKAVKWRGGRGDVVADFVESCRRYDVRPGIYMGTRWDAHLGVLDFLTQPDARISQEAFNRMIEREVEEICSRYGDLFELWFDGGILAPADGGPDVLPLFDRLQPHCLFYHSDQRADARWGGTESGTVQYPCWATVNMPETRTKTWNAAKQSLLSHGDPNGRDWCPAMSDAPIRNHEWFWEPGDEKKLYPVESLVNMHSKSVGRNSTLILGATPDTRGLIPDADVQRMKEMGDAIRRIYRNRVGRTAGRGTEVELALPRAASFDHVVLQEDIRYGERVREFVVEALQPGGEWRTVCTGECIGHKCVQKVERM